MFCFFKKPDYTVVFEGKKYTVNLAFDNVINVFSVFKDNILDEKDKLDIAISLLVGSVNLNTLKKSQLLTEILDKFINTDNKNTGGKDTRVVDYEQDSPYIYAGFMECYGIDLIEMQGILTWDKFISLFKGLSDGTKIRQIMSIRGRDLPVPTKYNHEEIRNLIELKRIYALDLPHETKENNLNSGLSSLFDTLKQRAVKIK